MKFKNRNLLLLILFLISVTLCSGIVSAQYSNDTSNIDDSSILNHENAITMAGLDTQSNTLNENSHDNNQYNTINEKTDFKSDSKLSTIYVNSKASPSDTGEDRNNPTTLNNALSNIADGGSIYLVTDSLSDTYNLTSVISISKYSNNLNSLNIIGEENKNITLSGNSKSQIFNIYSVNVNMSNINFADTQLNSSSAIYVSSATVNFINCTFTNNYRNDSGSSVYASYSTINLINSTANSNNADYGGVLYSTRSNVTVVNSSLANNTAFSGSAIYASNSNLIVDSSSYLGNNASFAGAIFNYQSNITCVNSNFTNNSAKYYGGAILHLSKGKSIINNTKLDSNNARYGGSIYIMQADLNIYHSVFENNNAEIASCVYTYNNSIIINNSCLVDNNKDNSLLSILYPKEYNLDENWWGVNNPDFFRLTGGYIPDTWVLMTFNNQTSTEDNQINLNVSVNRLSGSGLLKEAIPTRKVIFTSQQGQFNEEIMNITTSITNTYYGNSTIYARIDNQLVELNSKITPVILINNYTTNETNVNLTITANKDLTGNFNLTINNYTTKLTAKQKTRLYYPISDLMPGEYIINLTYSGNTKYNKTSTVSYLYIQSKEYTQNETITPIFIKNSINSSEQLPSKYNLLDYDLLTPVKSQGSSGSCVSFATIGVIESALKKLTNISYDLSENNVKNMFKRYSILGLSTLEPNDGGYDMEPVGYMASGYGPVLEIMDEYGTQSHISNIFEPLYQIQNVYFIPARKNFTDNDKIKKAIMDYGALYTGVKLSSSLNQYNIGVNQSTHAVCIVGWDDTYSRTNFSPNAPGDGAFIIKNSWGVNTGNEGYQYVSYYDSVIGNIPYVDDYNSLNFVVDCDNAYNYSNIYQYDSVVYVYKLGDTDGKYWINNSYTIQKDEVISAIGTYFVDDSQYEINVYINGNWVTTKSGKLTQAGYQTIQLDNFYRVSKNDEVTVVIGINQNISRNYVYVPLQDNEYPILSQNPKSFISYTGLQYENLKNQDSVAPIKVYTLDVAQFNTTIDIVDNQLYIKSDFANVDMDSKLYYKINGQLLKDSDNQVIYKNVTSEDKSIELTYPTVGLTNNSTLETILVSDGLNISKLNQFNPLTGVFLTADNITAHINAPVFFSVNVTDQDNQKVNDGIIIIQDINSNVIGQTNVVDGVASFNQTFAKQYDDDIIIIYESADYTTQTTIHMLIKKMSVNIVFDDVSLIAGQKTNITVRVTDEDNQEVTNGKLVIKVDGQTIKDANGKVIYAKIKDGVASVEYDVPSTLTGKNVNITAVYSGSTVYDSARTQINTTIINTTPTLTTENIIASSGQIVTLKANITVGNSIINSGKIVFKINGKTVKDENGKVIYAKVVNNTVSVEYKIPENYKANEYVITAVFISSDYDKLEDTKTLTIN